ncbi:MAG TPA: hypothetical protein VE077_14560 [Candidatus Methylomirabilis sp.]|nr:hypothetical protein [Candidatus Methylomirabilis sp.]
MKRSVTQGVLLLILLALGFAALWQLQQHIDAERNILHREKDDLVLRSGKLLRAISLDYAPLMADLYWTRAVQYYGDKHAKHDPNLELLWPLLDVTTTLDPKLLIAYRFGSTFLSEAPPGGAGRPDLGITLLERGIKANPEYWRFYEDLGFIYYFDLKDYAKASAAFEEGSKNPGALIWMKVMAAKIAAEGESTSTSIFLWNDIYRTTTDPQLRENALTHLRLLQVEQDCTQLDALAEEFQKKTGRRPEHMIELVHAGLLKRLPADPLGFVYEFGPNGKAELNLQSPLVEQQLVHPNFAPQQK